MISSIEYSLLNAWLSQMSTVQHQSSQKEGLAKEETSALGLHALLTEFQPLHQTDPIGRS